MGDGSCMGQETEKRVQDTIMFARQMAHTTHHFRQASRANGYSFCRNECFSVKGPFTVRQRQILICQSCCSQLSVGPAFSHPIADASAVSFFSAKVRVPGWAGGVVGEGPLNLARISSTHVKVLRKDARHRKNRFKVRRDKSNASPLC